MLNLFQHLFKHIFRFRGNDNIKANIHYTATRKAINKTLKQQLFYVLLFVTQNLSKPQLTQIQYMIH